MRAMRTLPPDVATPNGGRSHNSAEARERTAAQVKLSQLLNQQAELAADISEAGELRYHAVLAEIVAAQAEVDAERTQS